MKLLIKKTDNDGRLSLIPDHIATSWEIAVVDFEDRAALADALLAADAVISMNWSAGMPPAPRLKLLQLPGAGIDDIDIDSVPAQVAVCNVFEHEIGIAEYVLAAMLHWTVGLPGLDAALRSGQWHGSHLCGPMHGELCGQTLGIIGYGRIGMETAKRARAFGMRVVACNRSERRADAWAESIQPMQMLGSLLEQADFVLVSLPLDETTHGLINCPQFSRMKRSAVLINVARGPIVDEAALFSACREKRIRGAVIDAWYRYPRPQAPQGQPSAFPFHQLDNIVMTPHASGWTDQLRARRNAAIARNLDHVARGEPLDNVVRAPRDTI